MEAVRKTCRNERIVNTCLLLLFLIFVILLALFTQHAAEENLNTASVILFKQLSNKMLI